MANRTILTYFLSILGASLLFFGIASAGSTVAEKLVFGKRFGDHTYAGPFNLSKQTDKEAEVKLTSELLGMQDNLQADLVYQDATIPLPAELVHYNPSATIEQATSEAENGLVATVSEEGLRSLLQQQLPMLSFSDSEIQAMATGISGKLETGIMPQSIVLTDYLESGQPTTEIASASIAIDGLTPPMLDLLEELNGYPLEPQTQFSLLEFIDTTQPGLLDEDELTLLASALYNATLQTNFWIEDRTIRRALTQGVELGFEAAIHAQLGIDYAMTNPNHTTYTLQASWEAGSLNVAIKGLPLLYTYEPYVAETSEFEPKTVVQYSGDLSRGQVTVAEPGAKGYEFVVQRRIIENGSLLTTEPVSEDFYPPVSRVEQLPLLEADTNSGNSDGPDGTSGSGDNQDGPSNNGDPSAGNDPDNSSNDGDSSSGNNSGKNPGSNGNSTDGNKPSGNKQPAKNPDDSVGSQDGKPSTKPESDGHIYDKGGNLIK